MEPNKRIKEYCEEQVWDEGHSSIFDDKLSEDVMYLTFNEFGWFRQPTQVARYIKEQIQNGRRDD